MLKTRAMFPQKDQSMSQSLVPDPVGQNNNNNIIKPITNPLALSLLIGLNNNKCISDSDFVRSPKSPLEFRVLSTMADPFFLRSPRSSLTAHLNCCCVVPSTKVGLSIVDSLGDDRSLLPDVVFGSSLRIKSSEITEKCTNLVPKTIKKERSGVVFEIGDNASEAERIGLRNRSKLGAEAEFPGIDSNGAFSSCLSEDDMEDYTCIIAHGPNPKTTHIYSDRVLECHEDESKEKHIEMHFDTMAPMDNFLSLCNFCNKKLEVGEDIYMYREKSFCSEECREEEMMIDEEDLEDSFITLDESSKKLF